MALSKRDLAGMAVFTAFVAAATMVFSVFVAATGGYFNVGETMVYTAALLMGPLVGGFAGGVGSMLADLGLGYPQYAPGTLIIKGLEGFIVGLLAYHVPRRGPLAYWRAASTLLGLVVGLGVWSVGSSLYTGAMELTLAILPGTPATFTVQVPAAFWAGLAIVVALGIIVAGLRVGPEVGWTVLAVLAGGAIMVTGYFLYEYFALGMGAAAWVEVPINIGQLLVGLMVALPLTRAVRQITAGRGASNP